MASVKVILRTNKPTPEGNFPIAIQIIKERKSSTIHIGQSIAARDWNQDDRRVRRSHPNHNELNKLILRKFTEESNKLLQQEIGPPQQPSETHRQETITESRQSITAITPPQIDREVQDYSPTFFSVADDYINYLEFAKKFHDYETELPRIVRFKKFLNGKDIHFSQITEGLILKFKAFVKNCKTRKGTFISERTAVNHLVVIRRVYAHARKNKVNIPDEYYPFGKGKVQIKFPASIKIGLTKEEVELLERADFSDRPLFNDARNLWLFAFYFAGMRAGDVLLTKWKDIKNGRFYYIMGKNGKIGSLKIPEKALLILNQYRRPNPVHGLVFHYLQTVKNITDIWEVKRRIKTHIHSIDKRLYKIAKLLGIEKTLSMHVARHTFGNLAGNKIPLQVLQKLYRHSHISTTANYQQNFTNEDMDHALSEVLNM